MNLRLEAPVLALEPGEILSLDDACGMRIHAREGTVWVTEEGERRDFVVGPGEAFRVRRGGRTLVQAMAAALVALRAGDLPCIDRHAPAPWPLEPAPVLPSVDDRLLEARARANGGGV